VSSPLCPLLAVLPWLSYPGILFCQSCFACPLLLLSSACPVMPVLFFLSCSACPGLPVRFCLSCSDCPVAFFSVCNLLSVTCWKPCPDSPVLAVLSWQSCSACPVVPSLFCLSSSAFPALPVLFGLSWIACLFCLSSSAYTVLPVLFCLANPFYPALAVLS
jgi:hypothetical protein